MSSFLEDLRDTERHIRDQAVKELLVPGRGGRIAVRYKPPSRTAEHDPVAPVIAAYRSRGALSIEQEKQFIIDCHAEILRRDNPEGDWESYDPSLRFDAGDERWPDWVEKARDCVAALFALDKQPAATSGHADALLDWLQGLDAEVAAAVDDAGKPAAPAGS